MDIPEVVLGVPETPKLKDLADSTRLAFSILRPWCTAKFQSSALIVIQSQAKLYVKAIDFSITAAQHGYNVTEEVLSFSDLIDAGDEKDRQRYLAGMLRIALQGEQHTRLASEKFRNVRSMVAKLISAARTEDAQSRHGDPSTLKDLNDLEGGLGALEEFSNCISSYISWWNVIKMTYKAQITRMDNIRVNYNSLRHKDVIMKWRELGKEYVEYSNEIQSIQDSYPDFVAKLSIASSDDLLPEPEPEPEPEPHDDLDEDPVVVDSPPHNPMIYHFPGPLFAARYQDQQARVRKRDRFRKFGRRILVAFGAR